MDREGTIVFNVKLEKKDLVAFYFHAMSKKIVFKILVILYLGLLLFTSLSAFIQEGRSINLVSFIPLILIIIFVPIFFYFLASNEYKSNPRFRDSHTYTINPDLVHAKGQSAEYPFTWDKVYNLTETKDYFFIWQSKNSANIIPKRFLSEEDILFLNSMRINFRKKI